MTRATARGAEPVSPRPVGSNLLSFVTPLTPAALRTSAATEVQSLVATRLPTTRSSRRCFARLIKRQSSRLLSLGRTRVIVDQGASPANTPQPLYRVSPMPHDVERMLVPSPVELALVPVPRSRLVAGRFAPQPCRPNVRELSWRALVRSRRQHASASSETSCSSGKVTVSRLSRGDSENTDAAFCRRARRIAMIGATV